MRDELGKLAHALEKLNELFIPMNNCRVDPDPYWDRAQEACDACAEPQRTALRFILAQIAVVEMGGQQ